jgi:hypothetical protein
MYIRLRYNIRLLENAVYMLRPVSRIDHSADWAADLLTDRFFSIPPTESGPDIP